MNKAPVINQTTFHVLYKKYKPYAVPIGIIILCFLLILFIIVPQFQNWQTSETETALLEQKQQGLNKSLSVINNITSETLNNNLQLTTKALPEDKNFSAIINTITNTAVTASVALDDYTFQVGDLTSNETKTQYLQLLIAIKGTARDVNQFLRVLETQLPLSDVTNIQINNDNSAQVTVIFYYQPFPKLTVDASQTLEPLTSKEKTLLQQLQKRSNQ